MKKLCLLACAVAIGVAGCGDDAPDPVDIRVDTLNVALAGAFIPEEAARRPAVIEALRASESDIVCLQEVWQQSDKDMIAAAVAETFPHSVSFETDFDTPVDDPTDQNGMIPPTFSEGPCVGFETELEAAVQCIQDNCNTGSGSDGRTTSTQCAEENCVESVATILLGGDAALRCYACMSTSLPTETFDDIRNLCQTEPNAVVSYRGQSGVMILSRHPLRDPEAFIMPGTWLKRPVATATAELPGGHEVDVYCNHLTPIFDGLAFPYTGQYGDDRVGREGWAAEQLLQAEKLLAFVNRRSGTERPGIILGDLNAGRAFPEQGIFAEGAATLDLLETQLVQAVAPGLVPRCTHCPDNAVAGEDTPPVWIDHIYLHNLGAEAVVSSEFTYTEATVSTPSGMIPISDHYGFRSVITIQ